jgi:hypothetical protein
MTVKIAASAMKIQRCAVLSGWIIGAGPSAWGRQ